MDLHDKCRSHGQRIAHDMILLHQWIRWECDPDPHYASVKLGTKPSRQLVTDLTTINNLLLQLCLP